MTANMIAHVNFRVRCETLGHGEDVFLVEEHDAGLRKMVPLYTTASQYPWYHTLQPLTLSLAPTPAVTNRSADTSAMASVQAAAAPLATIDGRHDGHTTGTADAGPAYRYRYVVYRASNFHRWESKADTPADLHREEIRQDPESVAAESAASASNRHKPPLKCHSLPLRLLANRETYTVNDVLGFTTAAHPDIDHIRVPRSGGIQESSSLARFHSRSGSRDFARASRSSLASSPAGSQTTLTEGTVGSATANNHGKKKKSVVFAPMPPRLQAPSTPGLALPSGPGHRHSGTVTGTSSRANSEPVHLNSTDGLVVVSAFLPVILHRSVDTSAGTPIVQWRADWDYEMLLSMQTHLRVTRVGIVKWRGWHGNKGKKGSPEAGVPVNERHLVEECLRKFCCVPVWVEPALFGQMYNGFCKGVLWPIMHNVTSIYTSKMEADEQGAANTGANAGYDSDPNNGQFSEYSMDDVEQGPIHGGRGDEAEMWAAYNTVNRKFADVVVQCFNEGDLVWIHGFHLLILPSYLTRKIPMAKVGIFLHTPFPSSEIFRTVWCREDLLRGMLNADQVGFHVFEYARHFLTCCRRLLGLNYGMIPDAAGGHTLAIENNGRHVAVTSIHAGIEPPVLEQILQHQLTNTKAEALRSKFEGKTIFCAVDRLESLKGIPLKMLGLERFLKRCPEWIGKIVLIQVGISAYERGDDYVKTKKEVTDVVERINETWPGTIQFQECAESEMRLQQRLALMRAADVVLVTPIRDGLNLIPLEFTIAHQDALRMPSDGRKRGLCILSEFSSCTRVMRGALHVNPWKISEIANAFYSALIMNEDERLRRIGIASEFVTRVTTQRWALAVMLDLKGVQKNVNPVQYSGAGLGLAYRLLGMDMGFSSLDINVVAKSFKNARTRLILLDYGGTIVSNDNLNNLMRFQLVKERRSHSEPDKDMINAITELCADKRNTVFVVSGKERHSLSKTLGKIPRLGLAAEHGMFISWPTTRTNAREKRHWETLVPITDTTWRSLAITIMEVYQSRTHGSYIEKTEMKVLWQYRDADLEFGYQQARELEDHLSKYLRSFPVDILHSGMSEGGYVEVRPKGVNKGVLAMKVIRNFPKIAQHDKVEFALVLGDDHCDEPMLSVMRQIGRRVEQNKRNLAGVQDPMPPLPTTISLVDVSSCDEFVSPKLDVFTCTVGKKPSAASTYLHDVDEVRDLLEALNRVSTRDHRFYSAIDLHLVAQEQLGASGFTSSTQSSVDDGADGPTDLPKSMSLSAMDTSAFGTVQLDRKPDKISANLGEFLGIVEGDQEEEDDEDALCF